MSYITELGEQAGTQAMNGIMGMVLGGYNDKRQLRQQDALNEQQFGIDKRMIDYQMMKQLEMWNKTGYGAQVQQLKDANLNVGLLYGMKGGGGLTTGNASGGINAKGAPQGGREIQDVMGMGMQLQLLQAQKENIKADTALKLAEAGIKPEQGKNIKMDTTLKDQQQYGLGLDNAIKLYLQSTTPEGEDTNDVNESLMAEKSKSQLKQLREKVNEIGQSIELMKKQGLNIDQITDNLKKEGKLKNAEIEWNALDLKNENFGKFITNFLKMLLKPR